MFHTHDNKCIELKNHFKNQSVFLLLNGKSLLDNNLSYLNHPGIVTLGVNNGPKVFRPYMWIMVDTPSNFMISIYKDPRIIKFMPSAKHKESLFDNTKWEKSDLLVRDCPNIIYYDRNEVFKYQTFLTENTINWGNSGFHCECGYKRPDKGEKKCPNCEDPKWGVRSVMLAAIKLLYVLGFKNVFLLGADFKMALGENNYAFDQDRTKSSINNNNSTYARLNERFDQLRPIFEKNKFYIYNCNKNSGLNSFPKIDYMDALEIALDGFPDVKTERTYGMYERNGLEKKLVENKDKIDIAKKDLNKSKNDKEKSRIQKRIDKWEKQIDESRLKLEELKK